MLVLLVLLSNAMSDTEADADAAAAAGSNKRSRLNVAECVGDAADAKKSDQTVIKPRFVTRHVL